MKPTTSSTQSWLLPACVLALACSLLAFAPALPAERQLAGRDLFVLFYPLQQRVAARQQAGELLPGRDPARGAGTALLADPLAQVAYPVSWLRAAVPFPTGFKLWLLLHVALAGVGAAVLARALGASRRGACLAAAGASLAGPVLSITRHPNLLAATAWTGFALAGLVALGTPARRRGGAALLALSLAAMLLAGGGEIVLLIGLGAAVWLALQRGSVQERAGMAGAALAAAFLGGCLAALHLLPAWSWLAETERAGGVGGREAAQWFLHPVRLLELGLTGLGPDTHTGLRSTLSRAAQPFGAPFLASVHLGLPVLVLATLAARRSRAAGALLLAAGGWVVLALGPWTPLFGWTRSLPLYDGWRYPAKALLPVAVVLPALAGVGFNAVPRRLRPAVASITVGLSVIALWSAPSVLPTLPQAFFDEAPALAQRARAHTDPRDSGHPPARFLRIRGGPRGEPGEGFVGVRAQQRAALVADLPSLFGLTDLAAYGPLRNRRLKPYLASVRRGASLDHRRLADDAGVGAVLDGRLLLLPTPPRVRLTAGTGRLLVVRHLAERIEVDLDLTTPGRVYLSEAFDPAWRADIDGRPATVEAARIAFCEVAVPAGRSRLTLRYDPPRRGLGLLASAVGIALWLLLLVSASSGGSRAGRPWGGDDPGAPPAETTSSARIS